MKKYLFPTTLCLLLVAMLALLFSLRTDVLQLTETQASLLQRQWDIQQQLDAEASLFREIDLSFDALNPETLCVPLHIRAAPKNLQGDTKLRLLVDGSAQEFTRMGDTFTLDTQVNVFNPELPTITLSLEEGDRQQLEDTDSFFSRDQILPLIDCHVPSIISGTENGFHIRAKLNAPPMAPNEQASLSYFLAFTDWTLVATEDGQVIYTEALPSPNSTSTAPYVSFPKLEVDLPWRGEAPLGLWLQVTDSYGFVHQVLLSTAGYDASGYDDRYPELYSQWIGRDLLFRADGNLVHTPEDYPTGKAILYR